MRRNNIFWGTVLVILGFMFLLNTMGILSFDVWKLFWPVVLILLGLWFLLGPVFFKQQPPEEVSIPLEGIRKAKITLQHGAGELRLSSGAPAGELAAGNFSGGVEQSVQRSNDEASIIFNAPPFSFPAWPHHQDGLKWDIRLNSAPVFELSVKTGASVSHLDLTNLQVSHIEFFTGASATTIFMPAYTTLTEAKFEGGAASIKIHIPENVAARIHFEGGLIDMKVDQNRFPKMGDLYVSPNFDQSDHKAEIYFSGGVGSISVL